MVLEACRHARGFQRMIKEFAVCIFSLGLTLKLVMAAAPASDQAGNAPYEPGNTWANAQNGGVGFGAWTLTSGTNSGFLMGSSSANGNGSSGNIDTAGTSWGMFANSGDTASAVRPFTAGGPNASAQLAVGESISLAMDNGFIQNGGSAGFSLQNGQGADRFSFFYLGGDSVDSHKIIVNGTQFNLNPVIPLTTDVFSNITFTLGASNTWSLSVTENGGGTNTYSSASFANLPASNITRIRLFDANAGSGTSNNVYFNSLAIAVPEPSVVSLLIVPVALATWFYIRRRRALLKPRQNHPASRLR